jgi:hypothetical protein
MCGVETAVGLSGRATTRSLGAGAQGRGRPAQVHDLSHTADYGAVELRDLRLPPIQGLFGRPPHFATPNCGAPQPVAGVATATPISLFCGRGACGVARFGREPNSP